MLHTVSLTVALFILWLLLSGHYNGLLLSLGVISCIFVAWISHRMDVADHEGHPIHLSWRALLYWPWLLVEIVKSNWYIARLIVDRDLPISPRVIRTKASQVDDLGRVVYANSITLTPGTVSIDVRGGEIRVHAITKAMAEGVESGEMDRRVTQMEGRKQLEDKR